MQHFSSFASATPCPVGTVATSAMTIEATAGFDAHFRQAVEVHFSSLSRYLDRLSGDPALASDIAQETFLRLYRRGALPDSLRAWLITVAHNLLRDERRRVRRRLRLLAGRTAAQLIGDEPPAPDDALLAEERRTLARAALNALSERDRRLLLLRHEGCSYREIASILGIRETSVGTLLVRATAAFRAALGGPDASL